MALVALDGSWLVPIGPNVVGAATLPSVQFVTLDAAEEACIFIGQVVTADGGSHTIDTTGSSSLGWRSGTVTFANAGTTAKVGLAPVDAGNGPPGRAGNTANVINFDVAAVFTGGGGGITSGAWQTSVPTTGTKTVANGDFIAFAVQLTARAGADSVPVGHSAPANAVNRPSVTSYTGAAYAAITGLPNVVITFSDGTLGWMYGGDVFTSFTTRTWNSGSATKEYGQLYKLPFPTKIYGLFGSLNLTADCDVILYSDPLGATPVAEKTIAHDLNVIPSAVGRRFFSLFDAPYATTADQNIGAVFKPGASNVSAYLKTLASATHRASDPWGTDGYGISRASGAFADANSGLDHYYIGLLVGAADDGAGAGGGGPLHRGRLIA